MYRVAGLMISLFFPQIRQENICTQIDLVTRSCFVLCLLKTTVIVKALKKNILYFRYQKYFCQDKYPAGYPVSGLNRISIRPDIRHKQYPVHPY
jgi:hypothetical protein